MSAASDTGEEAPIMPAPEEEEGAYSQQSTAAPSEDESSRANAAYDPGVEIAAEPITIPMPNNNIEEKEKPPVDDNAIEMTVLDKADRKTRRERLFFVNDSSKRVDYVLVYEDNGDREKQRKRDIFQLNLDHGGLDIEIRDKSDSVDEKSNFVLLHATWDAIATGAELLNIRKRIKMPKDLGESTSCTCCDPFSPSDEIVPSEDDYFTAPFHADKMEMFDFDAHDEEERNNFFTNAERSLIVKELLDRTSFTHSESSEQRFGVGKLLREGVYSAAFPLHEGPRNPLPDDPNPWVGKDKDRSRLYEAWARPGRWYCYQPLDLIRKYFGEKIGIYFAWLGYYTTALIPAAVIGMAAFIYGVVTLWDDYPSNDICDEDGVGSTVMCPNCDEKCDYFRLNESCIYSRITYVFDNYATVVFAVFMGIWAVCFLEFWKRKQNVLQYEWDVAQFELEERMRPEFEFRVKRTKENPITKLREPYVSFPTRVVRSCTSYSVVLTMICLVVAAIFGVIVYRIIVVVILSRRTDTISQYSSIVTSITAAVCNLVVIMILNVLYGWIATKLTDLELHRTESDYENSLIFKMFLFKFVNFYGSTFYIAYFKGSFVGRPGEKSNYLFNEYRPDGCDPAGCMVDLFLHLGLVMVGKQALNNAKELLLPWMRKWWRARSSQKGETSENLYMRWEQDNDYGEVNKLGMFEEYLEMVIQYGFVTLFVAAFPLAPLFALLNNIIEIRLDAFKFVSIWRRPHAAKADGIGIWLQILQGISFIAVLTNAFIIGWTSDFVPKLVYMIDYSADNDLRGYMGNSLSMFNVSDFRNNLGPNDPSKEYEDLEICYYRGYRNPPGGEDQYEYTRQFYLIFTVRLAIVIIFEHICFLITWIISYAIPDTPAHVERLRLYEKQLVKKMTFDQSFADVKTKRQTLHQHLRSAVDNVARNINQPSETSPHTFKIDI